MAEKNEGMPVATERMFAEALDKMANALVKIADAVNTQAQTNVTLANGVRRMTGTIQGAQNAAADAMKKQLEDGRKHRADLMELERKIKGGEIIAP
jgi:hypothetical protein